MSTVFLGLMSGTSLDGVDGVMVDFAAHAQSGMPLKILAHTHAAFSPALRADLLGLNSAAADEIHRAATAANSLARVSAEVVESLLAKASIPRDSVIAIGAHGQTVRHRPGEFDGIGYTVQLNAPALLTELTGIDVIADFRSRDVAAGGQGAPLVPAFHRAVFGTTTSAVAVLNLGGIANLTSIEADGSTIGFDCGPANALLDLWCAASAGKRFDAAGAWAKTGVVDDRLLNALGADPYFARSPPKSTGRDLFNGDWLEAHLAATGARERLRKQDIQATLAELTAQTSAAACNACAPRAHELIICGGGAYNLDLIERISRLSWPRRVSCSDQRGLPADQVEAAAFAWLAYAFTRRLAGNIEAVTGAAGPRVLGALYPAR